MRVFQSQEIKDEAQVGAARRGVRRFAARLGFVEDELSDVDIVVQEMGTNAARYSDGGGRERARTLARRVGVWSRARPGEETNGDAYFIGEHEGETLLVVIDGLGHGRGAREASQAAVETLEQWRGESLDEVILSTHE